MLLLNHFLISRGVIIEDKVDIGPYARIRPDVKIQKGARIGNFVEIKKSNIGKNSKINHLSYVGDTVVGKKCKRWSWHNYL